MRVSSVILGFVLQLAIGSGTLIAYLWFSHCTFQGSHPPNWETAILAPGTSGGRLRVQRSQQIEAISEFRAAIATELEELEPGRFVFNASRTMRVAESELVEAGVTTTDLQLLLNSLKAKGDPIIEDIRVSTSMTASLEGDEYFSVKPLTSRQQLVGGPDPTIWSWRVTPLEPGTHELHLVISARIRIAGGGVEAKDYPVKSRRVEVKVNPKYSIIQWVRSANILGILTAVGLLDLAKGGVKLWWRRRQEARERRVISL